MSNTGLVLSLALVTITSPSIAFGHGGNFGGPIGGVPNGLRPPTDPTPPTPIDPDPGSHPGDPTPPDPTGGTGPSPSGPVTPNAPGDGTSGGGAVARGRGPALSLENWTFWWAYNDAEILRVKDHIYGRHGSGSAVSGVGEGAGNESDATRATEKHVKSLVIPALLRAMDPASRRDPDTESAAYLALARVTDDPAHIPLLVRGVLDGDHEARGRHVIVRESAALSLGLLRRTDAARRFDAKELDGVREVCFRILEDPAFPTRVRAFAAFSIALLFDQPTRVDALRASIEAGGGAPTRSAAERLFDLLRLEHKSSDLPSSLLLALSFAPPTDVTPTMREVVAAAALRGRLFRIPVDGVVQSYAALALGRMGTASEIGTLLNVLTVSSTPLVARRSAAIALGRLAETVDGPSRAALAANLAKAIAASRDATTRNFGRMSLARIVAFEAAAGQTNVTGAKGSTVVESIFKVAIDGSAIERPYGALALGLIGRAIGERPDVLEHGTLRLRAMEVLAAGFEDRSIDPRSRAAFAIGLGLVGDTAALGRLTATVAESTADRELRGYCAVAIGLIGVPTPGALAAVRRALSERSSEELRLQCAVALGLLGQPSAVDQLLGELAEADGQFVKGQVVLALGKIGDARAIPPLVKLLDEPGPDLTRAMACAGLGLIGDPEALPSLARLAKNINYRALVDPVAEMLSIL